MNKDLEIFDGIDAYNIKGDELLSPLCFIIDGILDIESFNIQFPIFKEYEQKTIQIFKNMYFFSLNTNIKNLQQKIKVKFESQHYSLFNI